MTEVVVEVQDIRLRPETLPFSLEVREREIMGVAGLEGHGQELFLRVVAGLAKPAAGAVLATTRDGGRRVVKGQRAAARAGIAYLPRDRKTQGILPQLSVLENFALPTLRDDRRLGLVRRRATLRRYRDVAERLDIAAGSPRRPIVTLSGGNQQKVLLARWLAAHPRLLVLDDPTRGVDVPTKRALYELLHSIAVNGVAVLFLSTEIEELVELCSRVVVFREHGLSAELGGGEIAYARIIAAMFGEAA